MAQKCVHKGCGQKFTDEQAPCVYHPGPPEFHEGLKGWSCCKPRVLTFDEFLSIPPCTTGKHSTVDDTPQVAPATEPLPPVKAPSVRAPIAPQPLEDEPVPPPAESEDDAPAIPIAAGKTCRRRGCGATATAETAAGKREGESCRFHAGAPLFHEGSKGWTCCKRRVLEFDEFLNLEGCVVKERHLFVGSGSKEQEKGKAETTVESVRQDFYQTTTTVHASLYLKKISKAAATVVFSSPTSIELDLPTADKTRYKATVPLFGPIDTDASTFKIMTTKMDLTLVKADSRTWPVLRADERRTGEIIQVGKAD